MPKKEKIEEPVKAEKSETEPTSTYWETPIEAPPTTPSPEPMRPLEIGDLYRGKKSGVFYLVTSTDPARYTYSTDVDAFRERKWEYLVESSVPADLTGEMAFIMNVRAYWNV